MKSSSPCTCIYWIAAHVIPEGWICHITPFNSQARAIARGWPLTSFPRLQLCQITQREKSLCSLFSPIDLSILQVWSFCPLAVRTHYCRFQCSTGCRFTAAFIIAVCWAEPLSPSSFIMKQHISRHFISGFFFCRCSMHLHAQQHLISSSPLVPLIFSQKTFQKRHNNSSSPSVVGRTFYCWELK